MNTVTRSYRQWQNAVLAAILIGLPLTGNTALLNLPQVPIFLSTTVLPNIMLMLDSSGSMNNVVPDAPYNPNGTYNCSGTVIDNNRQIEIFISSSGNPYFRVTSSVNAVCGSASPTDYDWGTGTGTGLNGYNKRCFNPTQSFKACLFGNNGSTTKNADGYLPAEYTGHYLNWYFGTNTSNVYGTQATSFQSGVSVKPGVKTRAQIAKDSAKSLIDSLSNVRMGLFTYDRNLREIIGDLNATKKSSIKGKIDTISFSGSTPIARTLSSIGRYYATGETNNLTLHPGKPNQASQSVATVFTSFTNNSGAASIPAPIQYFCQKSFAVLLTDGRPYGDTDLLTPLRDYDGDCPGCSFDKKPGREYEESGSDYLDDVAQALYEIDLRPSLPSVGNKPSGMKNNVATSLISFADDQAINDPLMQETATQGGGLFVTATNESALVAAFQSVIDNIISKTSTAAAVSFNSSELSTGTKIFLALFNSGSWTGNLIAYALDANTGVVNNTPAWNASALLDARNLTTSPRTILTKGSSDGVAFEWGNLTVAQQDDLKTGLTGTSTEIEAKAQSRLAFLRGDRTNEGTGTGKFRVRGSRLGDIVHSSSVFVGAPSVGWPNTGPFPTGTDSYSTFAAGAASSRTKVVYVGANDGMLHGFRDSDGQEILAYIPSNLFSTATTQGLHYLTDPAYNHRFYVDLTPVVSDAYIKTTATGTAGWHTILVGGQRSGGRGYFALDITDPSNFSETTTDATANTVMWEFTSNHDADLGFTFSTPTISLMNNGKWAAIFGNGYNNTGTTGAAQLFILYLEEGVDGIWSTTTDYVKITTEVGSSSDPNGLSTPAAVDLDGNGTVDRVYAGDLRGNLWAFDLSGNTSSSWRVAYGSTTPQPLFAAGTSKPITSEPVIVKNRFAPDSGNSPNLLVLFGTGQFLVDSDKTSTATQSFYGVWDKGTPNLTASNLVAQTFLTGSVTGRNASGSSVTLTNVRVLTNSAVNYSSSVLGWRIDLPATGERVVASPVVRGNNVFFNTLIPSSEPCTFGGSGYLMSVDLRTGGRPATTPFDLNGDNLVNASDLVSVGGLQNLGVSGEAFTMGIPTESSLLSNYQYTPGTSTEEGSQINRRLLEPLESPIQGRLSWEELENN